MKNDMVEFSEEQKELIKYFTKVQNRKSDAVNEFFFRKVEKEPYYKTTLTYNIEDNAYQE